MSTISKYIIVIWVSIIIALFRMHGDKSEIFQAIAHLWVGILIGLWIGTKNKSYMWQIIILSIIEVICFLVIK